MIRVTRRLGCVPVGVSTVLITAQVGCSTKSRDPGREEFAKRAAIGDAIDLPSGHGNEMEVTVVAVVDPLKPARPERPRTATRLIGVRVSLRNEADQTYDGKPIIGVITDTDEWLPPAKTGTTGCPGNFTSATRIPPGSERNECLPFRVPKQTRLRAFRLALVSSVETRPRRPGRRLPRRPKPKVRKAIRFGEWEIRQQTAHRPIGKYTNPEHIAVDAHFLDESTERAAADDPALAS